uniref:Uncharacterized protein n=1 Tax=Glossina morsitans morsitans TaxID=37546 RepID=A0A1B0FRF2_GLOMM
MKRQCILKGQKRSDCTFFRKSFFLFYFIGLMDGLNVLKCTVSFFNSLRAKKFFLAISGRDHLRLLTHVFENCLCSFKNNSKKKNKYIIIDSSRQPLSNWVAESDSIRKRLVLLPWKQKGEKQCVKPCISIFERCGKASIVEEKE